MRRVLVPVLLVAAAMLPAGAVYAGSVGAAPAGGPGVRHVNVPDADRFAPFAKTIHVGETVEWTNNDTDDHTVVSDDAFVTTGNKGIDHLLPTGGTFDLTFSQPGTFVYYCRFHARLDSYNQPVAPGPDGGIQGNAGNFGTPMSGVIVVLP